ncbi:MAG: glycosyltransferase [Bacteroidetes bacterium]|nr:glycosyltransferase [Bacteroidota bacterium]
MNILVIPSWYPGEQGQFDGIFIREQTEALADNFPQHNFMVSHCGNYYLSISSFRKLIKSFREFLKSKSYIREHKPNLTEYYEPAVTWTDKLGGEIKNICKVHTENYLKAKNKYGKIDLVHAHVSYPAGYAAMKLKEKFRVPYMLTEHMAPFPFERFVLNGKLSGKISEPVLSADIVTAPSRYQSEQIESFGLQKSVVVPNMVNENLFYPVIRERNKGRVRFLTLTTFTERKGIYELMESILKVSKVNTDCEFMIAGTGELENYIREFIIKNNLTGRIILSVNPDRDEVMKIFRQYDVFLLPSRLESFGIVYVEALACGMPVIATDCGGPKDFVNKDNGLLIEVGNIDQICDAVNFMTMNFYKYDSQKIREHFMNNFSAKTVCSLIITLYERILKQN